MSDSTTRSPAESGLPQKCPRCGLYVAQFEVYQQEMDAFAAPHGEAEGCVTLTDLHDEFRAAIAKSEQP